MVPSLLTDYKEFSSVQDFKNNLESFIKKYNTYRSINKK